MKSYFRILSIFLAIQIGLSSTLVVAAPRAYLRTDSGYVDAGLLVIDGKKHEISNFLMGTYDIADFSDIEKTDPEAWRSLYNHYRYGVAGTRGFVAGSSLSIASLLTIVGQSNPVIAAGLFLAGFIYGMNSRHMAQHNLHKAVNRLNGVME